MVDLPKVNYNVRMSWSNQRQLIIGIVTFFVVALGTGIPAYFVFFHKEPTCFDGIKNQDEKDVDCGGVCEKVCLFDSRELITVFTRFFEASKGTYNVVSLIENANQGVFVNPARYSMKLYDAEGVLLSERIGEVYVPPNKVFPIFEHSFSLGEQIPKRAVLIFENDLSWQKGTLIEPVLKVENQSLDTIENRPFVEATIRNTEVYEVKNIQVVALVYEKNGNAIGASQTVIPFIRAGSTERVIFSWNEAFPTDVAKIDIVPIVKPRGL